jgi:hypothetical protein
LILDLTAVFRSRCFSLCLLLLIADLCVAKKHPPSNFFLIWRQAFIGIMGSCQAQIDDKE